MPHVLTPEEVTEFRSRVCEAATDLLAEFGQAGFTMRLLARRLGVSAMTTYRYFSDKGDILAAVRASSFARLADRLKAAAKEPCSLEQRLVDLAQTYMEFARAERAQYSWMFGSSEARTVGLQEVVRAEMGARQAFVDATCMESAGGCHEDLETLGLMLWSSLHGIASLNLTGKVSDPECERLISHTIRVFVRSLGSTHESLPQEPSEHRSLPRSNGLGRNGHSAKTDLNPIAVA